MFKILYNKCFGGFSFSDEALEKYNELKSAADPNYILLNALDNIDRTDPILIAIVEEMGDQTNSMYSDIRIQEIPLIYKNFYEITEYDGAEQMVIHHAEYKLHAIHQIMVSDCQDKLNEIQKILDQ